MNSKTLRVGRSGPATIQVGTASYDIAAECLTNADGQEILLRQQSAQVFHSLAQNFGRLVTRDQLFAEIWADLAVTDDSLTQCIAEIRRAIEDTDRAILKTVPKRGFILHARAAEPDMIVDASAPRSQLPQTFRGERGDIATPFSRLDERDLFPTLAVLPFRERGDTDGGAYGAFLADEVIHAISQSDDLNIISRLSTFGVGIESYGPSQLGGVLNADYILSGTVISTGGKTHLLAEFSETERGYVLFSKKLKLPSKDLLTSKFGVTQVIDHIRKHISSNEIRKVRSNPLESLQLYSILRGSVALMHRLSRDDFRQSRTQLEHLIEEVPNHPVPKAWMARWHVLRAVQGWSDHIQDEAREALIWTSRALDIDPDNTLALVCEGQALTHLSRDLRAAQEKYDAALLLNPNDANGIALRGMLASFQDDSAHGVKMTERALHLTPLDPLRFFYLALASGAHVSAQSFDRAAELAEASLILNRSHVSTWRTLAAAYQGAGQHKLAAETVQKVMALQPELTVSKWLANSPSAGYANGKIVAELLRAAGIPD